MVTLTLARYTAPELCHQLSLNPEHRLVWLQNEPQIPINQLISPLTAVCGRTSRAAESYSRMMEDEGISLGLQPSRHRARLHEVPGGTPGSREGMPRDAGFCSLSGRTFCLSVPPTMQKAVPSGSELSIRDSVQQWLSDKHPSATLNGGGPSLGTLFADCVTWGRGLSPQSLDFHTRAMGIKKNVFPGPAGSAPGGCACEAPSAVLSECSPRHRHRYYCPKIIPRRRTVGYVSQAFEKGHSDSCPS